jgi:hypothetical protein
MKIALVFVAALCAFAPSGSLAGADIIQFELTGAAGAGLLEGNIDPATGEPGTGGIGASGIYVDTSTNVMHIHIEWGSAFGYTDMSQDVFAAHLHGPTAQAAPFNFGQTAALLINLTNSISFEGQASGGGVNDDFQLDAVDVDQLLQGRMYINIHLSGQDTGVIRGYLVQVVPEAATLLPMSVIGMLIAWRRRRHR